MEILLLSGCFLFVLLAVLGGGYWFLREPAPVAESVLRVDLNQDDGPIRQTLEKIGSILPAANDLAHPVRRRLIAAGYREPDALQAYFGIKAVSALLFAMLFLLLGVELEVDLLAALVFSLCGAGIGYLIPDRGLQSMEANRRGRLRQALPAALDLLVLSLEAGQALDSAMLETSRELRHVYPELSEELSLTHLEMRAGQSRSDVLARLVMRTGEPEVKKLTNLLLDGDRFGASLGPALRNHAKYTRLRRRQVAQEQARKTSVKLIFPVFFLIFPCVLLVTLGPALLRLLQGMSQLAGG
ncbi:type II secretion system F family protein [Bryobacter aggregatus]|uniref:type II secretion system F family protein n=1 Tax=Bryobacter aggregatus TaxID=360054 RepID=UPI00068F92FA|nr:type II secretion system F family protein [Bryobacter aggregatus]